MNLPDPDHTLASTLATWRLAPRRSPQFRAEVWARVEAARRAPTWAGYVRAHGALVAGALAVAVMLGAWTGRERARGSEAQARA